jgi:hypothetical protein
MTLQLIETKTLSSAQASIEFTSIPQDGTDLVLTASLRTSAASSFQGILVRPNGSTSNLTVSSLFGNGSNAQSVTGTNGYVGNAPSSGLTANTFANTQIYFPNYTGATNKSFSSDSVSEANQTEAYQEIQAILWSQTSAITSLTIVPSSGNWVAGSTISLYKITKGTDGIVTTS